MPKQKSHSGAILTKKASKRKRGLRKTAYVSVTQEKTIKTMIG